ncbi:MAG: NAD(P)/FAD-dependent oxidoreductase [Actinobacteria bacterium]|nr:NAD(P)/FAD-dependent oxidoreductase [Actinomycetota bacterium]MCB9388852.1 NAD(P)/FAD-dependent oxidoreductase [Acidimicrobiia bacterium]
MSAPAHHSVRTAASESAVAHHGEHLDVLIIGAGVSGIDAAHHVRTACPWARFAVLEGRERIGGTWDLFRYPGVRSDSDMFTYSFPWYPWPSSRTIGQGEQIRAYIEDAARRDGTFDNIRFGHRVVRTAWDSDDACWTVTVAKLDADGQPGEPFEITANFIISCTGYYRYEQGYLPKWDGVEDFEGQMIHPQHWPKDADVTGKRVVVIGSGATAVTLVPELARTAEKVTMLQRSPSYMLSSPTVNLPTKLGIRLLPKKVRGDVLRLAYVGVTLGTYQISRNLPGFMKRALRTQLAWQLPRGFEIDRHFKPDYEPWDQRLCVVADGDLFGAIRRGRAEVVTEHIDRFIPSGIQLRSGETIDADIVVTATGLEIQVGGGNEMIVDGDKVDVSQRLTYKGSMLQGVPNMAMIIGYTNASWTLKADLSCGFVARVIAHMERSGLRSVTPVDDDAEVAAENLLGLKSGYIARADDRLPRQGVRHPWRNEQSYFKDHRALKRGSVTDRHLLYT